MSCSREGDDSLFEVEFGVEVVTSWELQPITIASTMPSRPGRLLIECARLFPWRRVGMEVMRGRPKMSIETKKGLAMRKKQRDGSRPVWCDVVMRVLPRMYKLGQLDGMDDCLFVYANTFFSVREELSRGATDAAIRRQRRRILHDIDRLNCSEHEKEQFAGPFARAVDDALKGRPPCVLHGEESD